MTVELAFNQLHESLADPVLDAMNFLNEATARYPEAISFAPGRPYEGSFDIAAIHDYLDAYVEYLRDDGGMTDAEICTRVFQYGRTKGIIHDLIARTLAEDENIHVSAESIVATVGAQEAMLLTVRALCATRDDVLLVSSPCYVGIVGAARMLDIEIVPVAERVGSDPATRGPDPGAVIAAARQLRAAGKRVRAFYLVPDFANPSGTSLSIEARHRLLAAAEAEDFLLIEDNPYGFFALDDIRRPTVKSLDNSARVVYVGSFAKTCFPGARLGFVVADQVVRAADGRESLLADEIAKLKSMSTVNTPSLSQAVIGGMLIRHGFRLREGNAEAIAFYARNMRLLLSELEQHFPSPLRLQHEVSWNAPAGGFFVVVTVPFVADQTAMEGCARDYGVLWTPMNDFYVGAGGECQLRLSCSAVTPDEVSVGVRRLAAFIRAQSRALIADAEVDRVLIVPPVQDSLPAQDAMSFSRSSTTL